MDCPDAAKIADLGPLPVNLVQAIRLLFLERCLDLESRLSLRQACRAFRDIHDHAASSICLGRTRDQLQPSEFPSAEEVSKMVRGALARGCRPTEVALQEAANSEDVMLAFLQSFSCADTVERIFIGTNSQFTSSVAREVTRGLPKLSDVSLHLPASSGTAAAAQVLLQLLGPKLKGLRILVPSVGHWPADALEPLLHCTALTQLTLGNDWRTAEPEYGLTAETSLLRTLSSMTGLRALTLTGGAQPAASSEERRARAASLESCLSALTALTSLEVGLHCLNHALHPDLELRDPNDDSDVAEVAEELRAGGRAEEAARLMAAVDSESRALAAAVRCMPQLRELRTRARIFAADLAPLTALTYLRVGAIVLPPPLPQQAHDNQLQRTPVYDLPPLLERLKVYAPLSMRVAASLRRSPAAAAAGAPLISWRAPGLMFRDGQPFWSLEFSLSDLDDERRLTAEGIARVHPAVTNLASSFKLTTPGSDSHDLCLRVYGFQEPRARPPDPTAAAAAGAAAPGDGTHCGSWLGAMMSELRPSELELWGFALSPRDMLGMTRCMAGLKDLDLRGCRYSPTSLPLLGGLASVKWLTIATDDWEWGSDQEAQNTIEAAFLGLSAPAPRAAGWLEGGYGADGCVEALYDSQAAALPLPKLAELVVFCDEIIDEDWLRQAVMPAGEELRRRRPYPAELIIR
ncbi:hypothetical protein PLESTB_000641100 [Pleodorina starrii]|uniref:Uncharacterized protein n=1 Tax=Pleodorina starrii TaxID=330485 RepID=A0A9W6F157_9CHLO|nr:hypothetical protein PLESTM_001302300 [Pleodorina starrii]GLC52542.1 hypothetical protein PLESTB_000641100 [Pleodorina starrii]GLC71542.1 hypothetical protein PLESTF_001133200 [Pleodorina starrii]